MSIKEWCTPSPGPSDHGLGESISYESKELTPRPQKRPHGEEDDDPGYDPRAEAKVQGPLSHPIVRTKSDAESYMCPGISHTHKTINYNSIKRQSFTI